MKDKPRLRLIPRSTLEVREDWNHMHRASCIRLHEGQAASIWLLAVDPDHSVGYSQKGQWVSDANIFCGWKWRC
eukprot:1541147-Amphidinium_carterae.1